MSAANILGSGAFAGSVSAKALFKAVGVASVGIGAAQTVVVPVPFLKDSDQLVIALAPSPTANATGDVSAYAVAVQNSGLSNAQFTITATVAASPAYFSYMAFASCE